MSLVVDFLFLFRVWMNALKQSNCEELVSVSRRGYLSVYFPLRKQTPHPSESVLNWCAPSVSTWAVCNGHAGSRHGEITNETWQRGVKSVEGEMLKREGRGQRQGRNMTDGCTDEVQIRYLGVSVLGKVSGDWCPFSTFIYLFIYLPRLLKDRLWLLRRS